MKRKVVAGYRTAQWLLKTHAVTVLPSVASLAGLRSTAMEITATKSLVGFADPAFTQRKPAPPGRGRKRASRSLAETPYTEFWHGAQVDRDKLAAALPPLPDSADELRLQKTLEPTRGTCSSGSRATESAVKTIELSQYRIIYFATHGLVAGDVEGVAEPALVLSLPSVPSDRDDEVAQLSLNADWVVLSACNTIAGDKPGAEALFGLARSFFYAAARAPLVTHWAVETSAATRLTTSTFRLLRQNPSLGRSEALREAM